MNNLELKVCLSNAEEVQSIISQYFVEKLNQTDTYFKIIYGDYKVRNGRCLYTNVLVKLRETVGKEACMIQYDKPDEGLEKLPERHSYPIPDINQFWQIFKPVLDVEHQIKKIRSVYKYKNARIYIDEFGCLGTFLKIEIITNDNNYVAEQNDSKVPPVAEMKGKEETASEVMDYLVKLMKIENCEKILKCYDGLFKYKFL